MEKESTNSVQYHLFRKKKGDQVWEHRMHGNYAEAKDYAQDSVDHGDDIMVINGERITINYVDKFNPKEMTLEIRE